MADHQTPVNRTYVAIAVQVPLLKRRSRGHALVRNNGRDIGCVHTPSPVTS
jgi:hypothetical protein